VANRPGLVVERIDTDHVIFRVGTGDSLKIGDQVALIPGQQDAMVSRWDRFVGVRDGRVEAVWDILARGCHH
jgi:D-serine deaminase-like pyridoxal phosphate-dependent protein